MGARFAKWRAVMAIGDGIPSRGCMEANAQALARYAALCQEAGLVPVVEPEVLMDGEHTLEKLFADNGERPANRFQPALHPAGDAGRHDPQTQHGASGIELSDQPSSDEAADATVRCLLRAVPAAVPGIAFLSGGQSAELASARLNAMNVRFVTTALAIGVFVRPRHPAAGFGDLARQGGSPLGGSTGSVSSHSVQPGRAPW